MVAEKNQLTRCIEQNGLAVDKSTALVDAFMPLFVETEKLLASADSIVVSDATQLTEMKQARAARLQLKEIRVAAERHRKAFKEEYLRSGRAIDSIAALIKDKIEPVEKRLQEQEEFAAREEQKRKDALRISRQQQLQPLGVDTSPYRLEEMTVDAFTQLLESSRIAHQARLDAAKKAEEERAAAEQKRRTEEYRLRLENERLKAEQEEQRQLAAQQAAEAEAALANERAARAKIEADQRAEREAAEQAAAAEAKAKLDAQMAPDKDKVIALAAAIAGIQIPEMGTLLGEKVMDVARQIIAKAAKDVAALVKRCE